MARLRFDHIAGKTTLQDDWNGEGRICDYCHNVKIKHGERCWHIVDGFGYTQCKSCYIKELEKEILDIEWVEKQNKKIEDKIKNLNQQSN